MTENVEERWTPSLPCAFHSIPTSAELPIPKSLCGLPLIKDETAECLKDSSNNFVSCVSERRSYFINQEDLKYLMPDLILKNEFLALCSEQWKLLHLGTTATFYPKSCKDVSNILSADIDPCYCSTFLFENIGKIYESSN